MGTRLPLVMVLGLAVGCGGSAATPTPPGNTSFAVSFSLPDGQVLAPGEENTKCIVTHLDNAEPIHVGSIHNVLSNSSHHMILYRVPADTPEQPVPQPCQPFADALGGKISPIMISQKHDDLLTLPDGVAVTLDAHQKIRIEVHYINASLEPAVITTSSMFTTRPDYQFESDFTFVGQLNISIDQHTACDITSYLQMPPDLAVMPFYAITGHEHQFGTDVTVELASNASDVQGTSVYNVPGWSWSEPATTFHTPPFKVPDGGGFRFTCKWANTSNAPVHFGESAKDEMCFFWAYFYYPAPARQLVHVFPGSQMLTRNCTPLVQ